MDRISFVEAQRDLESVLDRVACEQAPLAVQREDGEVVVLVPRKVWEARQDELRRLCLTADAKR